MTRQTQREQLAKMMLGVYRPANCEDKYPLYNIYKDGSDYYIDVLAPGLTKENMVVTLKSGVLRIKGTYPPDGRYLVYEEKTFSTKDFVREFTIGREYEVTKVSLDNGILTIKLTKESDEDYTIEIE